VVPVDTRPGHAIRGEALLSTPVAD
jgi:hypothetical protein